MATAPKPQRPVFDELAPPDDPMRPRLASVSATAPFVSLLQPEQTDSILATRGGAQNLGIYRELLRDDQVTAAWGQRRLALTRCDTVVEPGADDALSTAAATELQAQLDAIAWDDITDKALYAVFYGWGVAEIMWRADGQRVAFDRIVVRDRARFRFDRQGGLHLWERGWRLMPERKFWSVRAGADNHDDLYGLGLAHALYWPVFFKRNDIKFWLIFLEKFGMPTALAKLPAGQLENPLQIEKAKEMLRQIATDAGVVVPDTAVIELLEAARSGTADYGGMHDAMNAAISKIIVGQTMTTDNGSSRAQAQVHNAVRQEIVEADSDLLCGSFNQGPVKWWTGWNFPGAVPPRVYRHTEPEEDLNARADRDGKIAALGFEPEDDYILKTYGEGWRRKADPVQAVADLVRGQGAGDPGAEFAEGEALALAAMRAARRGDQQAMFDAARAFAQQYRTINGERVGQLLQAAEFSEDPATFRRRLDEILAEAPAPTLLDRLTRAIGAGRMLGALRNQRAPR